MKDSVVKNKSELLTVVVSAILACTYFILFLLDLEGRWFNPAWTTDDALQQSFIFHEVFTPGIWNGDLITLAMRGYLAPVHYWLTYLLTLLSGNPIMGGHAVMAVQLGLTLFFIFGGVRSFTGSSVPAFFAITWFLHTRTVVQRFTGGLPRGWAAPVFAAYIYCIATRKHRLLLLCFLVGCLTNPPATFLAGFAYGLWVLWLIRVRASRQEGWRALKELLLFTPVLCLVTLYVIKRPPEIGQMVDSETAYSMAAFGPRGRFSFLPLPPIERHIRTYGYNAFVMRLHDPGDLIKDIAPYFVSLLLVSFVLLSLKQRRALVPPPVWAFFIAIVSIYLLSRQVVFKLYVPDRHLLIPMTFFLITACTVAFWRLFQRDTAHLRPAQPAMLGLLGVLIFIGSGTGFVGDCNFNYHIYRKGHVFEWLRKHTPPDSLIAGHPTHIDPVFLFAQRRGYVTSEVAHPFYLRYYQEMERRLEISLKAHYALTVNEFLELLEGEAIDYYVFSRLRFYGHNLDTETYYRPFDTLVETLTSRAYTNYAYKLFPARVTPDLAYMPFRDNDSVVIDVARLKEYIAENPEFGVRIP